MSWSILDEVYRVLEDRRDNPKEDSYTSKLIAEGIEAIVCKISEEAEELKEAARNSEHGVIHEAADLIFHTLVLLVYKKVPSDAVPLEFMKRRR
ncbi:MAG: phosphoribosyl-ATP diphosphatase [Nitrososphaerota archaeon]|nr:phosphoribosyl-ATP diphosphatase [Nitrososphaerota archaeon]